MLTSAILKVDFICDVVMTSTPNVLMAEVQDLLYNQFIDSTCCCSIFIYPTGRIRVCKIRFVSIGVNNAEKPVWYARNTFLQSSLVHVALIEVSNSTMSWSLLPIDGIGLHLCLKLGWEVSIRSKILSLRVGKSAISRLLSAAMSRNV